MFLVVLSTSFADLIHVAKLFECDHLPVLLKYFCINTEDFKNESRIYRFEYFTFKII